MSKRYCCLARDLHCYTYCLGADDWTCMNALTFLKPTNWHAAVIALLMVVFSGASLACAITACLA
jgi:hypothetical protein